MPTSLVGKKAMFQILWGEKENGKRYFIFNTSEQITRLLHGTAQSGITGEHSVPWPFPKDNSPNDLSV